MKLADCVDNIYILAYTEDTGLLEKALRTEGFQNITVLRPRYSDEELKYSRIARCLLNHRTAWEECSKQKNLSIILEADFVPIVGFSQLPLPFPARRTGAAWGWLYSCAQRVYGVVDDNFICGHSATTVATILDAKAARVLIEFVYNEFARHSPVGYFKAWDTYIGRFAQYKGVNTYIPFRSYGEHGGLPNPEHKPSGMNPVHRADVLWGKLHFLPLYAKGSRLAFLYCRAQARIRAVLRLFSGRFVEQPILLNPGITVRDKCRLIFFGFKRLASF